MKLFTADDEELDLDFARWLAVVRVLTTKLLFKSLPLSEQSYFMSIDSNCFERLRCCKFAMNWGTTLSLVLVAAVEVN